MNNDCQEISVEIFFFFTWMILFSAFSFLLCSPCLSVCSPQQLRDHQEGEAWAVEGVWVWVGVAYLGSSWAEKFDLQEVSESRKPARFCLLYHAFDYTVKKVKRTWNCKVKYEEWFHKNDFKSCYFTDMEIQIYKIATNLFQIRIIPYEKNLFIFLLRVLRVFCHILFKGTV